MARATAASEVPEVMTDRELAKTDPNSVVAIKGTRFEDADLANIDSFDAALGLLAEQGITVESADEVLGNGFAVIKDKGILCGVEMLILSWQFNAGDMGEFVSANVVARMPGQKTPAKFVINDGSSGIFKDLKNYTTKTGRTAGLHVKNGLTRSDYTYEDESTGEKRPATTFYLDTSA
jgi:hypothetical protein